MNLLGKLRCSLPRWMAGGHARGKRIGFENSPEYTINTYRCPRCGATWTRKIKSENNGTPTDGSPGRLEP